jgi:hypothetical protein
MSTDTIPTAIDDMRAVSEAVLGGRPIDPELARRIEERVDEARKRIIATHGLLDISVPYIRESREAGH